MAVVRYNRTVPSTPWRDFDLISDRFRQLFDDSLSSNTQAGWIPAVNVEENAEAIVLTAELPGLEEGDIEIELENNVLSIKGEKRETSDRSDEERRFHVWERRYGAFTRSFTLPNTVSADDIEAEFENGVLHIRMPKVAEAKGRKITLGKKS